MARRNKEADERVASGKALHVSSDMNITPMIDVLLVLLVIFMQALPLSQKGIDINLPAEVKNSTQKPDDVSQIVLDYSADKHISINNQQVPLENLEEQLRRLYEARQDKKLFVMGAGTLRYADIIEVIDLAKGAGVQGIVLITEKMKQSGTSRP